MTIERWHPFTELMSLRQAIDRLFDDSFIRPSRILSTLGEAGAPTLDVYQTPNDVVVKAALPGLKPEDVSIDITRETLPIKGESKAEQEVKEKTTSTRRDVMALFPEAWPFPASLSQTRLKQRWRMAF